MTEETKKVETAVKADIKKDKAAELEAVPASPEQEDFNGIEKKNIYERLYLIQQKLNVAKNKHNDFGNFFYRSAEDITTAIRPLLKKTRCILLLTDEILLMPNGIRYVKAEAMLVSIDKDESVSTYAYAREEESKAKFSPGQLTGSASSYARKYALNGLLNIAEPDLDENDSSKNQQENATKQHTQSKSTYNKQTAANTYKSNYSKSKQAQATSTTSKGENLRENDFVKIVNDNKVLVRSKTGARDITSIDRETLEKLLTNSKYAMAWPFIKRHLKTMADIDEGTKDFDKQN